MKCKHSDHGCTWAGELRNLEQHVRECSRDVISCPYSAIGCKAKVLKKTLADHKAISTVEHLELAMERIKLLEEKKVDSVIVPPVVFKMEDFDTHEDLDWNSPPFYTHHRGYKLYVKVCPGDDIVYPIISVNICLMRGEYDDELLWPFRGTISFELLNQEEDSEHKHGTARFLERRSSPKNKEVSANENGGRRDVGWGVDDILDGDDETLYIDNDSIYIRVCEVNVSDLNKPWLIKSI